MYCGNCGKELKEGNLFCAKCGNPINNNETNKKTRTQPKETNANGRHVIKIKLRSAVVGILVLLALLVGVVLIFSNKNNSKELSDLSNIASENSAITREDIEDLSKRNNSNDTSSLLEKIYAKYPNLKDDYICTNGEEYWILNNSGKKVYFDSLESFEEAIRIVSSNNENEFVDRNTFLTNYLTGEFKQILRENVIISQSKKVNEGFENNFISDRIEVDSEQIIYTYIYIYQAGHMKPALDASIFIILPNKQLPNNLDIINYNFNSYFVIKKSGEVSETFFDFKGALTDDEIEEKMPLVDEKIAEEVNEIKNNEFSNDRKKDLGKNYLNYFAQIPTGYHFDTYSMIASNHFSDEKYEYIQILDSNKVLAVRSYTKYTSSSNYKVSGYSEYMAVGALLTIDKLPFMAQIFTVQELIQTGYVSEDSKNYVETPIKKIMDTEEYSKEDYEQMYKEQDDYIRKSLGL